MERIFWSEIVSILSFLTDHKHLPYSLPWIPYLLWRYIPLHFCLGILTMPWCPRTHPTTPLHLAAAAAAAKSVQSCSTLCDPIDGSPPGSPIPGILQARTLEWVAISFSKAWKWKVKVKLLSHARLLATPWTAAYQAPPSMGSSRQEYWSGLPLPSPNLQAIQCQLTWKIFVVIAYFFHKNETKFNIFLVLIVVLIF